MSRAYIRIDPALFEKKVVDQGYSPVEFAALVGTLCLAEQQPNRGRFRNARVLRALLAEVGRAIPSLIRRGDLVALTDGRLYVDGWDEWQEGDVTVRERMGRIRNRNKKRNPDRIVTVNSGSNERSEADSGAEQSHALEVTDGWEAPESPALSWLHQHKCLIREGDGYHQRLIHAVERHGVDAMVAQFERMSTAGFQDGDIKGFLFGAIDQLDKATRPDLTALDDQEREAERKADWERRLEATRRRAAELRGEATA